MAHDVKPSLSDVFDSLTLCEVFEIISSFERRMGHSPWLLVKEQPLPGGIKAKRTISSIARDCQEMAKQCIGNQATSYTERGGQDEGSVV